MDQHALKFRELDLTSDQLHGAEFATLDSSTGEKPENGFLDYQPAIRKHFSSQGITYRNHFVTMSICCPSRVSLWTGMAGHNTNVTDVSPPFGGYPKFIEQGFNDKYLPVWLQEAGYNTYYTGKLMNSHSVSNYNKPFPNAGMDLIVLLIDPGTYIYNNATMQPQTLLLINLLVSLKRLQIKCTVFSWSYAIAPHSETTFEDGKAVFGPPVPAERYKDLYRGVKVPRTPNFNPEIASGASYVKGLPRLNETVLAYNDEFYRLRLEALASVDDLIEAVMNKLEAMNVLENTFIFYTADNGFHIGQYRLSPGKCTAYEEDITVPMFIRGPGVPKGHTIELPTTHTDIAPTILKLAEIPLQKQFDGTPMPIAHVNVEFWGPSLGEGLYSGNAKFPNNTYKSLRVVSPEYDISYTVWCTNEHELYDMKTDLHQMHNLWGSNSSIANFKIDALQTRLDALTMVLKSCKGKVCMKPWKTLHPQGNVNTLGDAMDKTYDHFYSLQPKVSFDRCALGYLLEVEGPQNANVFSNEYSYRDNNHWSDWA
ncbi:alkaline-phosphatase-like protein [Bipolaris maydis]|nr:alkaline-phosphatase-like protein [Bipolaris maydis]